MFESYWFYFLKRAFIVLFLDTLWWNFWLRHWYDGGNREIWSGFCNFPADGKCSYSGWFMLSVDLSIHFLLRRPILLHFPREVCSSYLVRVETWWFHQYKVGEFPVIAYHALFHSFTTFSWRSMLIGSDSLLKIWMRDLSLQVYGASHNSKNLSLCANIAIFLLNLCSLIYVLIS